MSILDNCKYMYFVYETKNTTGFRSVPLMKNEEFSLATAMRIVENQHGGTVIILYWHEISKKQHTELVELTKGGTI